MRRVGVATYIIVSGLVSGLLTGLLSIGGGLVTVTLLMAAPLLGGFAFHFPEIGAMTAAQSTVAMFTGSTVRWRRKTFLTEAVRAMAVPAFLGSLMGGLLSSRISDHLFTVIYACLATIATISLVLKLYSKRFTSDENTGSKFSLSLLPRRVATLLRATAAFVIAFLSGIVGITGGFILVPFMGFIYRRSDIRKIIGSAIIIQLFSAFGNILARVTSGPGLSPLVLYLLTGAVLGGYFGARFSGILSLNVLNWLSTIILTVIVLHAWYAVF